MKIIFRTDASFTIGTGHVMRCLTLADTLKKRGADVSFISRDEPGNLNDFIENHGFSVLRLSAGLTIEQDADRTVHLIRGISEVPALVIIDHYEIGYAWESRLRGITQKVMVIDDLADRRHDCDILLDQNFSMDGRYDLLVPEHCKKLIGPKYALLRTQFKQARESDRKRTGEIKRILVFMGGVDADNETVKVLLAIGMLQRKDIEVDIVVGPSNLHRNEIEAIASRDTTMRCHTNVDTMAGLMSQADLSIGAGGTTTWERCALGLPSLVISVAENQTANARALSDEGFIVYAGWHKAITAEQLCQDIKFLMRHPGLVNIVSRRAWGLVDAAGSDRVTNHLIDASTTLHLRPAQLDDCCVVFEWRNDPEIRKRSFNTSPLSWDEHKQWFKNALSSNKMAMLIAEHGKDSIGALRYDLKKAEAIVSVYLSPQWMGMGFGAIVLGCGNDWIRANHPDIKRLIAEIKNDNRSSVHAFTKAGFKEDHLVLVYTP